MSIFYNQIACGSSPALGWPYGYEIDYGDGTFITSSSPTFDPTHLNHTYTFNGTYTIQVNLVIPVPNGPTRQLCVLEDDGTRTLSNCSGCTVALPPREVTINCIPPACGIDSLIINTGFNHNTGTSYGIPAQDAFWTVVEAPGFISLPFPAWTIDKHPAWAGPQPNSHWISAFCFDDFNINNPPPQPPYRFQNCFCLCEADTVRVKMGMIMDDQVDLYVDSLVIRSGISGHTSIKYIDTTLFLSAGQHCLNADLRNIGSTAMGLNIAGTLYSPSILGQGNCDSTTSICGSKFHDLNCNGSREVNPVEPGVEGWPMVLRDANGHVISTTTTDVNGNFCFNDLPPGNYMVTELNRQGWTRSLPANTNTYQATLGLNEVFYANFGNCKDAEPDCDECPTSFAPKPGHQYVLSAWVKEKTGLEVIQYDGPEIWLEYPEIGASTGPFKGQGLIIDGWQRIEQVFEVPYNAQKLTIRLQNAGEHEVFFDDIRIFPFDANMKSFVYDPNTLRLMAELDENNYTTYYEYDKEGALIRVKKETTRGIMTIQESRNATHKIQD